MPVIEAMACGTPVLTERGGAAGAGRGRGVSWSTPRDERPSRAPAAVLGTGRRALRQRLREAGPGPAPRRCSWERTCTT